MQELKLKNVILQAINQDLCFKLEATLAENDDLLRLLGEGGWAFSHSVRPMTPEFENSFDDVSRDDDSDTQEYPRAFKPLRLSVEGNHQGREQLNAHQNESTGTDGDHGCEDVHHNKKPRLTK